MHTTLGSICIADNTIAFVALTLFAASVFAHCDTMNGPVVGAARDALARRDVTPVLRWVRASDEPSIRVAFARALAVRTLGGEARELADQWFFETIVRIHRTGEGEPFTGLKPADTPVPEAVRVSDEAIATGDVTRLSSLLSDAAGHGIHKRFAELLDRKTHADESIEARRRFVAAYIAFVHYAEHAHALLMHGAEGHHEPGAIPADEEHRD
jgi:hypothetical protein